MVDRIKQIVAYKQMSPTAFADTIDINRSSLTHIFSGRNQPSLDVAKKILTAFPDISTEWLIMGIGNMLQNTNGSPAVQSNPTEPTVSVSTIDNMQQTDLFSAMEMEDPNPVMEKVAAPQLGFDPEPDSEAELKPEMPMENILPQPTQVVPTPAPRSRGRNSESNISGRESKKERILNPQSDKKIAKIIFFYEDKSFDVYMPN